MPRTGGIYEEPSGTKGVTLQTIQSGKYNSWIDDIKAVLNSPAPHLAGGTGASTPDGAAEALGLVSAKDLAGVNTVGGTANAITIVTDRNYDAYSNSLYLTFIAGADIIGGGTTVDIDGNGAKPLYKVVAAGYVDVNLGDIITAGRYTLLYDGAADGGGGALILLNPSSNANTIPVGRFIYTLETMSSDFLRLNGGLYDIDDYPELAALLPALPDGVDWESISASISGSLTDVRQVPGGFMAMSDGGTNTLVYKSTDGETWTQIGTIASFRVTEFAYGNSIYVAGDGNGYTAVSNDGISWTKSGGVTITTGTGGISFGAGVFVLVGVGGVIKTSPDGVSWTTRTSGVSTLLNSVRFVNSVFVVVGASGVILTSPDGTTWTARTSGVAVALNGVAYGAGVYVVVGATGTILSSSNLTAWTSRTSGTSLELNDVVYSTSGFITVGNSGVARISGNGTSWTASATGVGTGFLGITFDPNAQQKYYVVGGTSILRGVRTLPTQFRVPNDNPTYGWVKAVS